VRVLAQTAPSTLLRASARNPFRTLRSQKKAFKKLTARVNNGAKARGIIPGGPRQALSPTLSQKGEGAKLDRYSLSLTSHKLINGASISGCSISRGSGTLSSHDKARSNWL